MYQRHLLCFALVARALICLSIENSSKLKDLQLGSLDTNGIANIILTFNQSTLETIRKVDFLKFKSRGSKIAYLKSNLETLAEDSQKNALFLLKHHGACFESFWISNQIFVQNAPADLISALSNLSEVVEIRKEKIVHIDKPVVSSKVSNNPGWAMMTIEAMDVWDFLGGPSESGKGVVVATIGTGVRFTHESLAGNYRSSYGWYDPIRSTRTPIDENGHGTHTLGTIVGSDGIGVAPGAQWISCRGCLSLVCEERHLFACGQWITCPTLPSGESSDCEQAPNVVSNSWTSGEGDAWYSLVINAWKSANIIPIFSIGNAGSTCGSVKSPGDDKNVIGVGATDSVDNVPYFSSRGPSAQGIIKPDVSAPGQNIRSAWFTGDRAYNTLSGTSMACPHVAGLVALMLSFVPDLSYDEIRNVILESAIQITPFPETACGGTSQYDIPNNIFGYGRINAVEAFGQLLVNFRK